MTTIKCPRCGSRVPSSHGKPVEHRPPFVCEQRAGEDYGAFYARALQEREDERKRRQAQPFFEGRCQ